MDKRFRLLVIIAIALAASLIAGTLSHLNQYALMLNAFALGVVATGTYILWIDIKASKNHRGKAKTDQKGQD